MKYALHLHRDAQKALLKAPLFLRRKAFRFLSDLKESGTNDTVCRIKPLQGAWRKYKYYEAYIDKDYRIIFRREGDSFFIRAAGTHNALETG